MKQMSGAEMTSDDIDKLEALANAATPGAWSACGCGIDGPSALNEIIAPGDVECMRYCYGGTSTIRGDNLENDLRFIAAANPDTVKALIAEVRRLRGIVQRHSDHDCSINSDRAMELWESGFQCGSWSKGADVSSLARQVFERDKRIAELIKERDTAFAQGRASVTLKPVLPEDLLRCTKCESVTFDNGDCNACVRIAELEAKLAAIPQKHCAACNAVLGKNYWSDVPGRGDLCEACHERK